MRNKSGLSPSAFHFTMLFSLFFTIFAFLGPVFAATTDTISFQSKLTNSDGTNISNGTYNFRFRMYSVASGGSVLWSEDRSLLVNAGVLSVDLGAVQSFPSDLFDNADLYLQVCFDANGTDADSSDANCGSGSHRYEEVFATRKSITAVPIALRAKYLTDSAGNAYGVNDFFRQSGNAYGATAVLGTTDAFGLQFITNGNVIGEFFANGDARFEGDSVSELFFLDASADRIGIGGTTTPDRRLEVLDTNPQLRLTHTDGSAYTDIYTDSNGWLYLDPSSSINAVFIGPSFLLMSSGSTSQINHINGTVALQNATMNGTSGLVNAVSIIPFMTPSSGSLELVGLKVAPTIDQSGSASGSYTALLVDVVETNVLGTGNFYARIGANGNYVFEITDGGHTRINDVLAIRETGVSPTYYTTFEGGDQTGNINYILPTSSTNGVLTNTGGVLNWAAGGGGGPWTDGSGISYLTDTAEDVAIGGSTLAASIFGIDESAGIFYFGSDNSANPIFTFEATDADTGDFGFNTSDQFYISGADFDVSGHMALGANSSLNADNLFGSSWTYRNVFSIQEEFSSYAGVDTIQGITNYIKINPDANYPSLSWVTGGDFRVQSTSDNAYNLNSLYGLYTEAAHFADGSIGELTALQAMAYKGYNSGTGIVSKSRAAHLFAEGGITTVAAELEANRSDSTIEDLAAGTMYGIASYNYNTVSVSSGIDRTYGIYTYTTRTGATGGTINTYGQYIDFGNLDNAGAGTHTAYGIYIDTISGADTNYALYAAGGDSYFAGNVGIGTDTPTDALSLVVNETDTSVWGGGLSILYDYAPTTNGTGAPIGIYNNMSVGSGNVYDLGYLIGIQSEISNDGSGDILEISGLNVSASNSGSGLIQRISGASISVGANDGTVDAMYGLVVSANDTVPGVTDLYGIYVGAYNDGLGDTQNRYTLYLAEDEDGSTAVNDFGLYAADPNVYNYFAGNVGIGTATPSSFVLQVAGDIGPDADDTYDLGSSSLRFRDLYLGGNTLHIGSSLTDEGTISYNTTTNVLGISTDSTTNGDIAFFTNQLFLDKSSGNVGIGTTAPLSTLNIADNTGPVTFTSTLLGDPGTSGAFGRYAFRAETTEAPSWTTSYNTPEVDVRSFAYDYENNVLYAAAGGGNGVIYRCPVSTGCDASGDWTEVYDASSLWDQPAIVFDAATNTIFSTSDGVVSRCDTSTGCDAPGDWANVFTGGDQDIDSLLIDTTESVLYAGSSWDYGIIYRCDIVATGCDAQGDFTTSFDSPDDGIETMVYDAENGTIYAGSEWGGEVYRCDTATDCDTDTDWTVSGDLPGSGNSVNALVIDTANDVLYATSDEVIYRCPLSSGCDALTDWSISFDTNLTAVYSLGYDATHERLFAGTGNTGIIYQCATSTGCDSAGDWVVSYDSTQNSIVGLGVVNGVVYAGSANGGFIYRFDDNTSPTYANYAAIEAYAVDTVTGTEDGRLSLKTMLGGTEYESLRLSGNASTFYTSLSVGSSVDQLQFAVRNNATQTTNLAEFQNSVGTSLTSINSSGHIDLSGNATPNAWNTVLKFNSDTLGASELAGGFTNGFIRSSTGRLLVNYITDNATNSLFGGGVSGDAYRRFTMGGDGKWSVGDGTGAQDTNLYRSAANQWTTDDSFRVNATLGIMEGTGSTFYTYFQGGDQSGDITYTLPTASTNGVLTNTGGVLSWAAGGGISQVGSMISSLVFGDATADDDWLGLGASAGRIAFDDQTIDYVNILDANVGIGTTTPDAKLTIQGTNTSAVLGSELLTVVADRDFSSNSGNWTGTNWTIAGGAASHSTPASNLFIHTYTPTSGRTYQITATVARTSSSGSINPILGNGTGVAYSTGGTTTATWVVVTSSTTSLRFSPDATWTGSIDNVSVKEITPSDTLLALNNSNGTVGLAFRSGGASGFNTFAGLDVGRGNLTGTGNSGLGYGALYSNTTGSNNSAFGALSLRNNTTGSLNVAMGHSALNKNLTGYNNISVGAYSLHENISGYDNVGVGYSALFLNTTGLANTGVGAYSLWSNSTGSTNTAVGRWSLYSNTTGGSNVAVGDRSLYLNISGSYNVGIGQFAAQYTNANYNVAVGYSSLERNTTGTYNVALGTDALAAGGTGSHNVALGPNALGSMTNEIVNSISAIENYDSTVSGTVLVTSPNHSLPTGTSAGVEIDNTLFYNGVYSVTYVDAHHFYMTAAFPEFAIVSFADYSGTEPGTVLVTINTPFVPVGMTAVTISGTTYYDGYYPATYVSDTSFYITESWMGDDATGLVSFAEENGYFYYDGLTLGNYNLAAGSQAGQGLIRGANNTFLGGMAGTGSQKSFVTNSTAIGYGAYTTADNQIVLGNTSVTQTLIRRGTLGLSETGGSPQYYTFFQGGDQSGNITYTLPTASTNGVLTNTGGVLSWVSGGGGGISQVGSMTSSLVFGDATADDDWLGLGASAGRIAFDDQTTDYVNILDAKVGIGYATPLANLDVQGTTTTGTLGSELITTAADRDFSSSTGNWTGANWSISGGNATHMSGLPPPGLQPFTLTNINAVVGKTYRITFDVSTSNTGTLTMSFGGTNGVVVGKQTGTDTQEMVVVATTTGNLVFTPASNWSGSLDNISVKEVTPTTATFALRNSNSSLGFEIRSGGSGLFNTYLGFDTGRATVTGGNNTALGYQAFYSNVDGNTSAAFGTQALFSSTSGNNNTAIGYQALYSNTVGDQNNATGTWALKSNTTGSSNVANGFGALFSNTTGSTNLAAGVDSLYNNISGNNNNAQGYQALYSNTTGNQNNGLGLWSLYSNTTGNDNNVLGYNAAYYTQTGSFNTIIGSEAGKGVTGNSYSRNSIFGYKSGFGLTTGSNNMLFGYQAGDNLTTGSDNIIIGYDIDAPSATGTDQLNIGGIIFGTSVDATGTGISTGNIGIRKAAPDRTLDVDGNWGGNVVISSSGATTSTITIATKALMYDFTKSTGTTDTATTTTWNITGLPNIDGTFAYIKVQTVKGVTATARIETSLVQINGTQVSSTATTSVTAAQTVNEIYIISRTNGAWHIAGGTPATALTADLAEWYKYTGEQPMEAEIVGVDDATGLVELGDATSKALLGVVSTAPFQTMGEQNAESIRLALSGRVPVIVTTKNGEILPGDQITASSILGVGQKSNSPGPVVGKSLESTLIWTNKICPMVDNMGSIIWPADSGKNEEKPCFTLPDGTKVGKIMMFINLSYNTDSLTTVAVEQNESSGSTRFTEALVVAGATLQEVSSGKVVGYSNVKQAQDGSIRYELVTQDYGDGPLLGVVSGLEDSSVPYDELNNAYKVTTYGAAKALVIEGDSDIAIGQSLGVNENGYLASSTLGTFAKALESINWQDVSEYIDGKKVKEIMVFVYANTDINNAQDPEPKQYWFSSGENEIQTPYKVSAVSLSSITGVFDILKARILSVNDLFTVDDTGSVFATSIATPRIVGVAGGVTLDARVDESIIVKVGDNAAIEASVKGVKVNNLLVSEQQAGKVNMPAGQTSITVSSTLAFAESIIVVTPSIPVITAVKTYEGYFEISLAGAVSQDVELGWYIVNINNE